MGSAQRRANVFPIESAHLDEVRVACNTLVVAYTTRLMWLQREIPTEVIISWMGATTAEIIGILWVIARSLFPFQDEHRSADLEKSGGGRIGHPRR